MTYSSMSSKNLSLWSLNISRRSNTSVRSTASKGSGSRYVVFLLFSLEEHIFIFSNILVTLTWNQIMSEQLSILNSITWVFKMMDASAFKKSGCLCYVMKSKFQSVIKESTLQEPIAAKSKRKKCEFQYWNFSQLVVCKIFFMTF